MLLALLTLGIGAAVGFGAWSLSETQRIRRLIKRARTFTLEALGEGRAGRIIGTARVHRETVVAPLTGRTCVYYIAEVGVPGGGKASDWQTIVSEEHGVLFAVEDATGRALVDAASARLALDYDLHAQSTSLDEPSELQRAFLQRHRCDPTNRALLYREAIIADGETIAVLGSATRELDPDALPTEAYRGNLPTRLRFTSSRRHPLVISDHASTTRITRPTA